MVRALRVCSRVGCPNLTPAGRCEDCTREGRRISDQRRDSAARRGYNAAHRNRFRAAVLRRDPICTCPDRGMHDHGARCMRPATRADHWPLGRDELVAAGLDPNDPARGRGLCAACDSAQTARRQPGGWNRR